eukprot:2294586-Rhodomonas_salina.1
MLVLTWGHGGTELDAQREAGLRYCSPLVLHRRCAKSVMVLSLHPLCNVLRRGCGGTRHELAAELVRAGQRERSERSKEEGEGGEEE